MASNSRRTRLRRERYMVLIRQGLSPTEARRLRDQSGAKQEVYIDNVRDRIIETPARQRSARDRERLKSINEYRATSNEIERLRRTQSKSARVIDFSKWSNKRIGFPVDAKEKIIEFNHLVGKTGSDPYGYRRFYYWYVEQISQEASAGFADRNDSPRRHERRIPLRSRRKL